MKKIALLFILLTSFIGTAQKDSYIAKGFAVEGYDVVAYFSNKAVKGNKKIVAKHNGVKYLFATEENKNVFNSNPDKYLPQYGGWCAYAMGVKGDKVSIDPETFEIRDGKLYLFYNSWGVNTLNKWLKNPESLKTKADNNWSKL